MQIVYWAHSYREEDAVLNRHFGILIERAANMVINFDPPLQQGERFETKSKSSKL
jgi:hypothetical protein